MLTTSLVSSKLCGAAAVSVRMQIKEEYGRNQPLHALPIRSSIADTCVYCGKPAKKMVYWGKAY